MEIAFRCFFRLGILMLLLFVAFRNFRGFPQETEAIIRGVGFGHSRSYGNYHSNYGGRTVWQSFGRGSGSRRNKYVEPIDKNRAYYEKKMAEWREKNKEVLEALEAQKRNDTEYVYEAESPEELNSEEYEYDYDEPETTTTSTTTEVISTASTTATAEVNATAFTTIAEVIPTISTTTTEADGQSIILTPTTSTDIPTWNPTEEIPIATTTVEITSQETTTVEATSVPPTRSRPKSYGLRYGRVKVERLQ